MGGGKRFESLEAGLLQQVGLPCPDNTWPSSNHSVFCASAALHGRVRNYPQIQRARSQLNQMDCPSSLVGRCQTESMLSPFVLVRFQLHLTLISSLFAYEKDFLVRLTPDLATSRIKVASQHVVDFG